MLEITNKINTINLRHNRFKANRNYSPLDFENFDFKNGLKSIDDKDNNFINKAESTNEEVYDYVINMYLKHTENDYTFLDDFVGDEIILNYRSDRLLKIINKVQKKKYTNKDLKNIKKLNCLSNPELHLFIKMSRNNATLILIDLYHLAIFGRLFKNGKEKIVSIEKNYRKHRYNTVCLDDIKELC